MTLVKLKVQHVLKDKSIIYKKYAVSILREIHPKVKDFIQHIQTICQLSNHSYHLSFEGFILPENQSTQVIQKQNVYTLQIKTNKPYLNKTQFHSIKSKRIKESSSSHHSISSEISEGQQNLSEEVESISNNDQSSSQQKIAPKKNKLQSHNSNKSTPISPAKINKRQIKNKKISLAIAKQQKKKIIEEQSSSSQSSVSECSEKLPHIAKKKVIQNIKQIQIKANVISKKPSTLTEKSKKVVIKYSSEEESEEQIQISDKKIVVPEKNQSYRAFVPSEQKSNISSTLRSQPFKLSTLVPNNSKLPPVLRNKYTKKTYQNHKENQWILVTKQILKKWLEKTEKNYFCSPNNKIRFKVIELDEQKFIPMASNWIVGEVMQVSQEGLVTLSNVVQEGKPFKSKFSIPEHNMEELQVFRLQATQQQLTILENKEFKPQIIPIKTHINQPQLTVPTTIQNDNNSMEKFVCGQINYYFSDKNYNTDLYMQMHANRHPQKWISISFLLNFPKIKKIMRDANKILQFLIEDESKSKKNYQIDQENKMIRKKDLQLEGKVLKEQEKIQGENQEKIKEKSVDQDNGEKSIQKDN